MSFVVLVLSYLLGSVPFGLVLTKLAGLGDLRQMGSGNIGATNVLRTGRKDLALATLLLDSGKGAIAVGLAAFLTQGATPIMALAGAAAFLGHCFPIFLRFKGGKGVATFLGTLIAFSLPVATVSCLIWLAAAFVTRYSSLSALIAAFITPWLFLVLGDVAYFLAAAFMAALIFYRHKANIWRLVEGTEPKIGKKKT